MISEELPREPQGAPQAPKRPPRDPPKPPLAPPMLENTRKTNVFSMFLKAPKDPQGPPLDLSRAPRDLPRTPQGPPKELPGTPRTPPGSTQGPPGTPKDFPRSPQGPPGGSESARGQNNHHQGGCSAPWQSPPEIKTGRRKAFGTRQGAEQPPWWWLFCPRADPDPPGRSVKFRLSPCSTHPAKNFWMRRSRVASPITIFPAKHPSREGL